MQSKYIIGIVLAAISAALVLYKLQTPAQHAHDTLLVGTNAEYQPFSFVQDGKIVGFDIDIVYELAHRMGKEVVLKDMAFTTLLPELQMGKLNVVATGISPTPERAQAVLFLQPHHTGDPLLLISPKTAPVTTVGELANKTVIVNDGFTADSYISKIEGANMHVLRLPTVADAFLALKNGRADAYILAQSAANPFFAQHGKETWAITPIPDTSDTYALPVSKKHPELYQELQKHLSDMMQDGTTAKLAKKWGLL